MGGWDSGFQGNPTHGAGHPLAQSARILSKVGPAASVMNSESTPHIFGTF